MSLQTMIPKKTDRKDRVLSLKAHHEDVFMRLGIKNPLFDSKAIRVIRGEAKIGFFESQLKRFEDLYFEINDFNQNVIDPDRTLYNLPANIHFASHPAYEYIEDTPAGPQYYVKVTDCKIVKIPVKEISIEVIESEELEDCNMHDLTLRDHVCISLKVPETSKPWLNDLIKKSTK